MPKVSVIIPVYNSEKYIGKCLDSVINQTLTDIEIFCIDDCSTDNSRRLLENYKEKDKRIRVMYNENNKGQSFSRNRAMEAAGGEYIQFLDSDDYLSGANVLDSLYTTAKENELDLLKSEYYMHENGMMSKGLVYPKDIIGNICSGENLLYQLESHNINAWGPWISFVKLNFLKENKISFYNGIIHEDVLYSYDLYYYAERAMCIDQYTYYYIKHDNSTTTKQKNINHLRGYLVCVNEIVKKDFADSAIEFRYATIKYFMQMYNNVVGIKRKLDCSTISEMLDDTVRELYEMLWGKSYVNEEKVIPNINVIAQSEELYIFGAGKAAGELLEILAEHDIAIDGIFVTDTENSAKTLLGHKVMGIDTYRHSNKQALFLVAITEKYIGETMALLHSKGIENIICVC